jgi:hypothetical protein
MEPRQLKSSRNARRGEADDAGLTWFATELLEGMKLALVKPLALSFQNRHARSTGSW